MKIIITILIIAVLENFAEKFSLVSTNGFKDVCRKVNQIAKSGVLIESGVLVELMNYQ